ncbi:hypothetical protein [Rhizobium sp. L1K21]|uniref:hypothetical protein n=1 Tax=Rhizobium sp. L1K21 TaxID=2954933 RepID=UPI002092F105|nr:hypothetical protein [Rhizobium sp. L1K21]MCO6186680.1 hypothetical protein [Rhizobium sp. L1K21]
MDDLKLWYQSRTVWGALIAILASVAQMGGVHVDTSTQGDIAANLVSLSGALGGLIAIYGRVKANKRLG